MKVEKCEMLLKRPGDIRDGPLRHEENAQESSMTTLYYIYYHVYKCLRALYEPVSNLHRPPHTILLEVSTCARFSLSL